MGTTLSSIQDHEDDIKSFRSEAEKFEVLLQKQTKQLNLWAFKFEQWLRSYNFVRFHRNWLQYLQRAEHIYFTGIGKNQPIAEKTANMMRSVGIKAHYFDITNALHGDLGVLSKNDVVVGISKSGKTVELANAFKVRSIPTLVLFKGGEVSKINTGFLPKDELLKFCGK